MLVIYRQLTAKEVREVTQAVAEFFALNPHRKTCRTLNRGRVFKRATFRQEIRALGRPRRRGAK